MIQTCWFDVWRLFFWIISFVIDTFIDALTLLTIRTSIVPDPSDPPLLLEPPAREQLPIVTQMHTPTVLLFTIKLVCDMISGSWVKTIAQMIRFSPFNIFEYFKLQTLSNSRLKLVHFPGQTDCDFTMTGHQLYEMTLKVNFTSHAMH